MNGRTHTSITDELKSGKNVTYFTVGSSMRPLLTERKTHVNISPIGDVKNGDILLYIRKNGALVLHRCIKRDAEHYYMRGDNTVGLEKIKKEQAVGRVTHIYRRKKLFCVDRSCIYRAYVSVWNFLYPLRRIAYGAREAVRGSK